MANKELVEYIVKALVDSPESVEIREIDGEKSTIIELRVAKDDVGKVIGKHGRIARAIRTLNSAAATKSGRKVVLEILD
ncbi:MAG TPA: KH domain-containing protein [Spirochaetota bacterium]|nr:KH domain-containing protein [Spirochaetota bacterium]